MQNMAVGDAYDRLRIEQGAGNGGVKVTPPSFTESNHTQSVGELAQGLTANTAVINGGFFDHLSHGNPNHGKPVGPTKGRKDFLPIQEAYKGDYRALNVGNKVGISSGPILEPSEETFEDARFKYENRNNPKYNARGSLTHADNKNPRAAISIFPPEKMPGFLPKKVPGDVIMHTLTPADSPRGSGGATMGEWQDITTQGSYQYKPDKKGKKETEEKRPSTLNLDGGNSLDMGITRGNGHTDRIASVRNPALVSNMIFAGGDRQNKGKKISIKGEKASESCELM